MKQKIALLILSTVISISGWAQVEVSQAKVAELACHRAERLVTLKKIDAAFVNNVASISVVPQTEGEARFKAYILLYPDFNGQQGRLEIDFDANGKVQGYSVNPTQPSVQAPTWPELDSVTLVENSLHYILDGWAANSDLKIFNEHFKSLVLTQVQDGNGKIFSKAQIFLDNSSAKLEVILKTDGTLQEAKIVP